MGLCLLKNKTCALPQTTQDVLDWGQALLNAINAMVADKNVKDVSYCSSLLETLEYVPPVTLLMEIDYVSENFLSNPVK